MTGKEPPSAPRLSKGDWPMSWLCCYQSSFHRKKTKKRKNILYASFCMTCWAFIDFISFSWINLIESVQACEGEKNNYWRKRRQIFQFGGFGMGIKSSWKNTRARKPGSTQTRNVPVLNKLWTCILIRDCISVSAIFRGYFTCGTVWTCLSLLVILPRTVCQLWDGGC